MVILPISADLAHEHKRDEQTVDGESFHQSQGKQERAPDILGGLRLTGDAFQRGTGSFALCKGGKNGGNGDAESGCKRNDGGIGQIGSPFFILR